MKPVRTEEMVSFEWFFETTEQGLRYSLIAVFGVEDGRDAAAHALLYGYENWDRLQQMANPAGYLYRVGRTWGSRNSRQPAALPPVKEHHDPWVEPGLPGALALLPEKQRVAVVLRHGCDWDYGQIGDCLGISPPAARKSVERGLSRLRAELEVSDES